MRQFKKRMLVLAAAGVLTASTLAGCGQSVNDSAAVASVGEEEITYGVANFLARMEQGQYETYYAGMLGTSGDEMWNQMVGEDQSYEDMTKSGIMDMLQNMYVLRQHAADYGVELTDEDLQKIDDAAKAFVEANDEAVLEKISGTEENVKEVLELMTIQSRMNEPMLQDVDTEVSDEEAAQKSMMYVELPYNTTAEDGTVTAATDEEKAQMKETVESIAAMVNSGEAEDLSTAAESAGQTANKLTFDGESTAIAPEVIAAADALAEEGSMTDVIETENGVVVAQLTSLFDEEATTAKKDAIVSERKNEHYSELLTSWKDEIEIKVDDKAWNKLSFKKLGVTVKQPEVTE